MYVKPYKNYEHYLAIQFINWVKDNIYSGVKYAFQSSSIENSERLYQAFIDLAEPKFIDVEGIQLPYIDINEVFLLPVLQTDGQSGFTENYISHLRDLVSGRDGKFNNCALFIIHNSMLDTLINSSFDVAETGAIWHPETLKEKLTELIDPYSDKKELSQCLLDDQLTIIIDEGATVFGFAPLFRSLNDGVLEFRELGLFNDPFIEKLQGNKENIRQRLAENRILYYRVNFSVEHYPDQLESNLKDFSSKFIKEHFEDKNDWADLHFEDYLNEIESNKSQQLTLENIESEGADLIQRAKSQTKAGQKELSLLIEAPTTECELKLKLTFYGNDLKEEQLNIVHNKTLFSDDDINVRRGGKRSWIDINIKFTDEPIFFSLEVKRDNRSEEYKFRCLVIRADTFYIDEIKNNFIINTRNSLVTLLLEEDKFCINPNIDKVYYLDEENDAIDVNEYGFVDFEDLATQTDLIQFDLCSDSHKLRLNIEAPAVDESITLPLLFDQERFSKLFKDSYNAEFNRLKNKIIIDNSESKAVAVRQQLLTFEAYMVDERLVCTMPELKIKIKIKELQDCFPELYFSYSALFDYYDRYKTLPSLVSWGETYCKLVESVLDCYESALKAIPTKTVLSLENKTLLQIGLHSHDKKERISPLHPLVLSYHLNLVKEINKDTSGSFSSLPSVTIERLVASELLPFVYHPTSEFAHISPVKDNTFWLDIVPQRQISYSYVKRLVEDKIAEFTSAYSRLFKIGVNSGLIINAINQNKAEELFLGLIAYFKSHKEEALTIHVNFYDDTLAYNEFDRFAETSSYDELKSWLNLNGGAWRADSDMLIDLVRSRLTYSKFITPNNNESLTYAHLAFFSNNAPVDCRPVSIDETLSGVLCDGLIAGAAAETKDDSYFTAFGLRGIDINNSQPLRLARLLGNLWQAAKQTNAQYLEYGIGLAVSSDFKNLLTQSYDSALWTTIIDPKVTLDFFTSQKDVVLIHYSDQYTTSAGYDAITVTKRIDLFRSLLQQDSSCGTDHLLAEFNAFNGEWLLKLLTANENERKEKNGIIGAYKFVSAMLRQSDICWIPLSVAEIIRVSGNVGLKMSESEFSRHSQGMRKGAISDDVLFVGFKDNKLYLLPLEVKTGVRPDFGHAAKQAKELKRYLTENVLQPSTFAARLYRGLFIRQVLMQVDKFRLYNVLTDTQLQELLQHRERWLQGNYEIGHLVDYPEGFTIAHIERDSYFEANYTLRDDNILQIELPYSLLDSLISASHTDGLDNLLSTCKVKDEFILKAKTGTIVTTQVVTQDEPEVSESIVLATSDISLTDSPIKLIDQPLKVLFGHDSLRQLPIYWEPTNTARFMNTNTGIIGTMRTGKTQFTKSVITQLIQNQDDNVSSAPIGVLIFDYKADYIDEDFSDVTNSKILKPYQLPYNPLSLSGDMPMLPVHTATGFAETLAKAFGLGHKQQLKLRKLILEAYDLAGISRSEASSWGRPAPTIAQVWDLFIEQEKVEEDSLYAALDNLISFEIFEQSPEKVSSLYDLMNGVTIIRLDGYSPQIQNLVVALTLDLFYSQMQKKGKPKIQGDYRQITKMVLVDEADNFMSQDFPSLRKILKEGREYGVGVILSTQDISHFKTNENNYANYVLTWIIHRVSEIKNADIKSIFNKDDKSEQEQLMEVIRRLEKHYSLYIDGDKKVQKIRDKAFWELIYE